MKRVIPLIVAVALRHLVNIGKPPPDLDPTSLN